MIGVKRVLGWEYTDGWCQTGVGLGVQRRLVLNGCWIGSTEMAGVKRVLGLEYTDGWC